MVLILPQTTFEAIPPKDVGGDALLAEADASPQILDLCCNNIPPIVPMALTLKYLNSQKVIELTKVMT